MAKRGLPNGAAATTELWLPGRDGVPPTDRSVNGETVTAVGAPTNVAGYFGTALDFSSGNRLEIASPSSNLNLTGSYSIGFYFRSDDGGNSRSIFVRRDTSGSLADVFSVAVSSTNVIFDVWSDAPTKYTVTATTARGFGSGARWIYALLVREDGVGLKAYLDGQLVGFTSVASFTGPSANLPEIQIGGEVSDHGSSIYDGRLEELMIWSEARTDVSSMSPNLRADRITREKRTAWTIDTREELSGTWTADGDDFYLAVADIDLGTFVKTWNDVSEVRSSLSGTESVWTNVGNQRDLDNSALEWFWDSVDSRLVVSQDPTILASTDDGYDARILDAIYVYIPTRVASIAGMRQGSRYFIPAVLSDDAGTRSMPFWGDLQPAGGGGQVALAAQHSDFPSGLGNRDATGIWWQGANVTARMLSPGMPWAQRVILARGFVDKEPTDDGDVLQARVVHAPARFFEIEGAVGVVSDEDHPRIFPDHSGRPLMRYEGTGHIGVPCVNIDTIAQQPGGGSAWAWQWKVLTDHAITYLSVSQPGGSPYRLYEVDLDAATFWIQAKGPTEIVAEIGGLGLPRDATSEDVPSPPIREYGNYDDTFVDMKTLFQARLQGLPQVDDFEVDSTWDITDASVGVRLRLAAAGDFVDHLAGSLRDSRTHIYFPADTGKVSWEVLDTSATRLWTITDADVLADPKPTIVPFRANVCKRAEIIDHDYYVDSNGMPAVGHTVSRKVDGNIGKVWKPARKTGFYNADDAATFLDDYKQYLGKPEARCMVALPDRYAKIEQHDPVENLWSRVDPDVGSSWRVRSVHPTTHGPIVEMYSEANHPSGATSLGKRKGMSPVSIWTWTGDAAGHVLADTSGSWNVVRTDAGGIFEGDWITWPTDARHYLKVYADRTAGSSDTDLQFRLRALDTTEGGTTTEKTIATLSTISTTLGFQAETTSFDLPLEQTRFRLEFKTENSGAGVIHAAGWFVDEGPNNLFGTDFPILSVSQQLYNAGDSTAGSPTAWTFFSNFRSLAEGWSFNNDFLPQTVHRFTIYVDGTGTGGYEVGLGRQAITDVWSETVGLEFTPIPTTTGFVTVTATFSSPVYWPVYKITSGTGKLYAVSHCIKQPYREVN